ncbi:vacuolar assembly protein did2 [Malassezia pachydermatis]|uniref:Vacuolar assembly protein did2 n=1 Tax=Malassezia pachydermatis TaxID=77020 RepID=A0A0M9VQJ4_9BASI|nr:vacuolar assembly protein did2 [Malassezia pachydermatis]KOS15432.1 vacuolar assembly protein did2 [Malassezia pachydermatis]
MSGLEKSLFQLKFTAKSLQRQANKASRDEVTEKAKLKKVRHLSSYLQALAQGNTEGARIYAANSIRKKNESLNLLRLSSRIDAVASRVETAVSMRQSMDLERISMVMDKFENQLEDVDVQTSYMETTMNSTTASGMPQDQVDLLMQQVADENGIEVHQQLGEAGLAGKVTELPAESIARRNAPSADQDEALAQRLRALRPAT